MYSISIPLNAEAAEKEIQMTTLLHVSVVRKENSKHSSTSKQQKSTTLINYLI